MARPSAKEAIQEILRVGGLSNCPMCMSNNERLWRTPEQAGNTLRLACGNCSYIVEFDLTLIGQAIEKRAAGA